MKKSLIYIAALTLIAACNKVESPVPSQDTDILIAQIEQETSTKTYMDAHNNIRWSEGDQVVAFMKSSLGLKYQVSEESVGKTSARFVKQATGNSDDLYGGTDWNHNVVYYPYSATAEAEKSNNNYALNIVLPSEQTYAAESFGSGSMAMVAVSEDNTLTFKNILGGMKLQLRGTQKVKSIKLEGKNNEKLSGAATVTAYTDETKPAITMASGASTSVTLKSSEGVQLNESKATEFIISLPPVLFSKGFTVTVTDAEGQTYTVGTDKANTVLRSSILTMPAFKLGETPDSETPENAVDMIFFDVTNLTVVPETTYTLTVDFEPYDAADKTLVWNSSNPSVASVDASGVIKALADGTSTITAVAVGGATATCSITVISCTATPSIDYVADGVNYGKGIAIGDVVWAPVNCGYEAPTDTYKGYPYGKLYQWGRPYGLGYDSDDASYPSGDNLVEGPVVPSVGLAEENKYKFYYNSMDWSKGQKDDLWNSGTESSPIKTKYDPCPEGWRVPIPAELDNLKNSSSPVITVESRQGLYFCGGYTYLDGAPQVFFPSAGVRYIRADAGERGWSGNYWSSSPSGDFGDRASYLRFVGADAWMSSNGRAHGCSVRCVEE